MKHAHLINPVQAMQAWENQIWPWVKAMTAAGHRLQMVVKLGTRSAEANARLHATIADVAKQVEWAGQKRDIETWKRLLTAAWLRARGESIEILPAIDGHGIDVVFRRTSSLTGKECAELCEFIYAWGVEHGVRFTAPEVVEA